MMEIRMYGDQGFKEFTILRLVNIIITIVCKSVISLFVNKFI